MTGRSSITPFQSGCGNWHRVGVGLGLISLTVTSLVSSLAFAGVLTPFPPSVRAVELAEIQARGKLRVAVKDNLRPLGFRDASGQLQGLEIELARQLAEELVGDRTAVELIPVRNDERLDLLLNEEVDLVIAQFTATRMRSRLVQFSRPYYLERTSFITLNPQIQTYGDLGGQRIAVLEGSGAIALVRRAFPQATLVGVESYQAALELLEMGGAEVFGGDRAVLVGWAQEYPAYQLVDVSLGGDALAIAMPKGRQHSELFLAVNTALEQLKASGWLATQQRRWGLAAE
ncbi:MAG: transporter substrate-binding domain-containing protein [Spirulinaceae cyanobacterium]